MFICDVCVEKYEGSAIEGAKAVAPMGVSRGPCEVCRTVANCYDVPSWADWRLKTLGGKPAPVESLLDEDDYAVMAMDEEED